MNRVKSKWIAGLFVLLFAVLTMTSGLAQDTVPPLSEQVGFSDPKLDELQAAGQNVLGESQEFQANNHTYRLLTVWSALPGDPSSVTGGSALLYQMDGNQPML